MMMAVLVGLALAWEGYKNLRGISDLNMPHLSSMVEALSKPNQRGSDQTLFDALLAAALFTMQEAIVGFVMGTAFGLLLAVIFVHSDFLQRGLMPFVVASQTVPILAIAPMVVIWTASIDARPLGVPLIAAYLAFFPVTIYALRGLADVPQTALELMDSYAASRWEIFLKLRLPNSLPYIFTALKITAPASVVGAIIGELPAGIQDGLGGAILQYNQSYISNPTQLWATILITAITGILFFAVVAVAEKLIVRWKPPIEMN
jgi:NitT/TauT family transport system permease protein